MPMGRLYTCSHPCMQSCIQGKGWYSHINVGFGVARSTQMGNAKASNRGTSDNVSHVFLCPNISRTVSTSNPARFMLLRMKYVLQLLLLTLFVMPTRLCANEPFRRHYILVVDQTISMNNTNMGAIYRSLCSWLRGESPATELNVASSNIPQAVKFDEKQDALSLFAFGLTGVDSSNGSFAYIHNRCFNNGWTSLDEAVDEISKALIHPRSRFAHGHGDGSFKTFLSEDVRKLFNGTDQKHQQIASLNGITMSHFVYPLIMEYISKEETANEYYLIIVSDFMSGLYSNNDADDWERFRELTAGNIEVRSLFERRLNSMRAPFVQADYLHFQAGNIGARGTRIFLKSVVQKSQVYLSSSLALEQVHGNTFDLNEAKIAFDKDKQTTIDSIQVVIKDSKGIICQQIIATSDEEIAKWFDKSLRLYTVKGQSLNFTRLPEGDVNVTYVLYTMSHNETGDSVLPIALMASQDIAHSDIVMINQTLRKIMIILTLTFVVLLLLTIVLMLGRKKKLNVEIGRFAQKFMNVTKEHGATELPCWFHKSGSNSQSLRVKGSIARRWSFSIGVTKKFYVRLQEGKPNGVKYFVDGKPASDFIEKKVKFRNGTFAFNINIEVNPSIIDVNKLNECSIVVDFKIVSSIFGLQKHEDYIQESAHFFLIHDLGTAWVGLDPGTTGSCVTVGSPSGTPGQPSIRLIKNTIIPSKLVLKYNCMKKEVEDYIPGRDYVYGEEAHQQWEAHLSAGRPCFQSIKKLLGYKNADGDKIAVEYEGGKKEYTGLDLASLLVKGLHKDMQEEIDALSASEHQRYAGRGKLKRAVVAIPNNYTLPKILEMVESVRRLRQFEEVRYVYEAEAILFNHFRQEFAEKHPAVENIMVYDMGGATINISVFYIEYEQINGTTYYHVHTLGRIGYGVGGDNIDFAIMEYLFTLGKVNSTLKGNEKARLDFEKKNRLRILSEVLRMKLNVIKAYRDSNDSTLDILGAASTLQTYLSNLVNGYGTVQDDAFSQTCDLARNVSNRILRSEILEKYVYNYIDDAVKEIVNYPDVRKLSGIDKVIFAGRSTLFPFVRENVMRGVKAAFPASSPSLLGNSEALEVKSAVANGACWYGIYSNLITLDNSRSFGTYGFKLTRDGKSHLETLLPQNTRFDDSGRIYASQDVESNFHADGSVVNFYQVMGSANGDAVFDPDNRHKVNSIGYIDVPTGTSKISMTVDLQNKVCCEVVFETGNRETISEQIEGRDITRENDLAYTFAADNAGETLRFCGDNTPVRTKRSSTSQPNVPRKTSRF